MRFLDGTGGRVDEAVAVVPAEAPDDDSEELAACLADALVILPLMMVSMRL